MAGWEAREYQVTPSRRNAPTSPVLLSSTVPRGRGERVGSGPPSLPTLSTLPWTSRHPDPHPSSQWWVSVSDVHFALRTGTPQLSRRAITDQPPTLPHSVTLRRHRRVYSASAGPLLRRHGLPCVELERSRHLPCPLARTLGPSPPYSEDGAPVSLRVT